MPAWPACPPSTVRSRQRRASAPPSQPRAHPVPSPGLYTDFVPLFLFAVFTSAQYLQVGAVAVVSLLTNNTVTALTSANTAAVAVLKSAASSALKAYNAQPTNAALYILNKRANDAYNAGNSALIQQQVQVASLLAFFVGIFSFGIGFLKLGNVMNLMGAPVISGFQTAASITIAMGARALPRLLRRALRRAATDAPPGASALQAS